MAAERGKKGLSMLALMAGGKGGKDEPDGDEGKPGLEIEIGPEEEDDGTLPPGLVEAIGEFRNAETDEEAASAFKAAVMACK